MSQPRTAIRQNLMSLQSHILQEEARYPGSTGEFTWILSALSLAAKAIAYKVRVARLEDVLGDDGRRQRSRRDPTEARRDRQRVADHLSRQPAQPRRRRVGGGRGADDSSARGRRRQVLRDFRSARWIVESRRLGRRRDDLLDLEKRPDHPGRGRDALSAWIAAGGGWVHLVWLVHGVRPHHRQRRRSLRPRSVDRLLRAGPEQDSHPADGEDVFGE